MLRAIFPKASSDVEERGQATTWGSWAGDEPTAVTGASALKLLAVTGSVQLLSESISTLPVDVFRRTSAGRIEVAVPAWLKSPMVGMTFVDWCSQVLTSLLLHGNAYLSVLRDDLGRILEVVVLDPTMIEIRRVGGRRQFYVNGAPFVGEVLHIKGMMLPGSDVGLSPLEFARQSIQLGLSAQQFGIDSFDGGMKMPGVIEFPGSVDPVKMGETARLWQRARRKGGQGLPGVLEGGGTFRPTGITNEAAQFLETRQWTAAEICASVYLVDPRELGIPLTGSTLEYVTSESRLANLVRKGMLRWIVRVENAVSTLLPQPQYMKLNTNAFMRGDSAERWDTYVKASQINTSAAAQGMAPVLLTDEMRDWEDLDPLPAADAPPVVDVTPVDAQMNAEVAAEFAELRSMLAGISVNELRSATDPQPINVNLGGFRVDTTVDTDPIARAVTSMLPPNVVVNVEPTPVDVRVTNDVQPAAVTVTNEVSASPVMVNVESPKTKHVVRRDAVGNIVEVIEETV